MNLLKTSIFPPFSCVPFRACCVACVLSSCSDSLVWVWVQRPGKKKEKNRDWGVFTKGQKHWYCKCRCKLLSESLSIKQKLHKLKRNQKWGKVKERRILQEDKVWLENVLPWVLFTSFLIITSFLPLTSNVIYSLTPLTNFSFLRFLLGPLSRLNGHRRWQKCLLKV